jgi:TolB protein
VVKVTVFKDIPSDNYFGPVWSPEGSKIAFSLMAEKEWQLGLVNADGSGFRFVKNAALKSDAFGAPCWLANDEFLCLIQKENETSRRFTACP